MAGEENTAKWDVETDVVVVGSGAGGLVAAIAAYDHGAKVSLLEKSGYFGGATAFAGGGMWVPNNKFLRAGYEVHVWDAGKKEWIKKRLTSEEDIDMAKRYMKNSALGMTTDDHVKTYVNTAWKVCDYLEEHARFQWSHVELLPEYYPEWDGAVRSGRTIEPLPYDSTTIPTDLVERIGASPAL